MTSYAIQVDLNKWKRLFDHLISMRSKTYLDDGTHFQEKNTENYIFENQVAKQSDSQQISLCIPIFELDQTDFKRYSSKMILN